MSQEKSKRFVSWAAVSSQPQAEKISLQDQLKVNREHIEKHSGLLIDELVVPGESRDIVLFEEAARRMDAYKRLGQLIEGKAFDVLIFLNLGRLGRDIALIMAIVRLCQRAHIAIYATESPPATLDPSDTYNDTLITVIKASGYQNEITELKRRNLIGMIDRVESGNFPSRIPWPWLQRFAEDGTEYAELDKSNVAALEFIQAQYLDRGLGAERIAQELNAAGHPSPDGKEWTYGSVSYVIANAWRYAGYIEYNRRSKTGRPYTKAKMQWPAVWNEITAKAIEAERHRRWAARGSVHSKHRFSQVVYCEVCGHRMRAAFRTTIYRKGLEGEQRYQYEDYRCGGDHKTGKNIPANRIVTAIEAMLDYLETLPDLAKYLPTEEDHSELLQTQLEEVQGRQEDLQRQLERADDAYTTGAMDHQRYQRQVARIQKQLAAAKEEEGGLREALAAGEDAGVRLERLTEFSIKGRLMLSDPDISTANAWFRQRIRIWVNHGYVSTIEPV